MKSRCFNLSKAVGTYFCRTLIIHISWSLSSARECIEEGGKKLSPRLFGTVEQYIYVCSSTMYESMCEGKSRSRTNLIG